MRASRWLLRSFLEVAFFWSFRGRNLSFVFLVSKIWKKCDGGTKKTTKLKNGHYFWLRAPRRVLSSFLKVAFFWSFLGWNLIFCISCYKNLKKYGGAGGGTKNDFEFFSSQIEFFSGISKKIVDIIIFLYKIQKKLIVRAVYQALTET